MSNITKWIGLLAITFTSIVLILIVAEIAARMAGFVGMRDETGLETLFRHDSLLGWHHVPNSEILMGTSEYSSVNIRINPKGLRDEPHHYRRITNRRRILVLGDSFAWGWGVQVSDRFTERLEELIPDVEVINAGVPGYSTDQECLWLEREGLKYKPDLVILLLFWNDLIHNQKDCIYLSAHKPLYVLESDGSLVLTRVPCPEPSLIAVGAFRLLSRSSLISLMRGLIPSELVATNPKPNATSHGLYTASFHGLVSHAIEERQNAGSGTNISNYGNRLTVALVQRISKICANAGCRFLLASHCGKRKDCLQVIRVLKGTGVQVCRLYKWAGFRPRRMSIPNDGHWNSAGHEFAARTLVPYVTKLIQDTGSTQQTQ
jgi:lysophospholipase L1-like esterase